MGNVQVTSEKDVTRLSAAVALASLTVVTTLMVILYPREQWLWEVMVGWPTTTLLAYGATNVVGRQMLRNHELTQQLQKLLSRDRLTDVATRDFFFASLMKQPQSYGVTLMIDIDYFKQVNDTHGHLAGDKVIAHVARLLSNEVGTRDIVCRFGGEEFVVFLENATPGIAREVAERFRERVAGSTVDIDGAGVSVTVSIGASLHQVAAEIDTAIREADAALYLAKAQGRNRTVMAKDMMFGPATEDASLSRPAA